MTEWLMTEQLKQYTYWITTDTATNDQNTNDWTDNLTEKLMTEWHMTELLKYLN